MRTQNYLIYVLVLILCIGSFLLGRFIFPAASADREAELRVTDKNNGDESDHAVSRSSSQDAGSTSQRLKEEAEKEDDLKRAVAQALGDFKKTHEDAASLVAACRKVTGATLDLVNYYRQNNHYDSAYLALTTVAEVELSAGIYGSERGMVQFEKTRLVNNCIATNGEGLMQILRNEEIPNTEKQFIIDLISDAALYGYSAVSPASPAEGGTTPLTTEAPAPPSDSGNP
jgi:hypothetical protein